MEGRSWAPHMKTIFSIIFVLTVTTTMVSAAGLDSQANETFPSNAIGPSDDLYQWGSDTDVAWKNAFTNQYTQQDNPIQIHSSRLLDQDFSVHFLYKHRDEYSLHDDSSLLRYDFYEIGSRIEGDWGDITLSFENSHIETAQQRLPTSGRNSSSTNPFSLSKVLQTRTNGRGSLNLAEGIGLDIELEYLSGDKIGLHDSHINQQTLAYSADLNTQFGSVNTRTIYFHMDRNHDFSRYGDYSLHGDNNRGFRPLYILTGTQSDIFTEDGGENSFSTQARKAGMDGVAFIVDYKASPRVELHTAIGAANTDKTPLGYVDYYGWEANLGLGYKILDNLTFELHLGYMATADFFNKGVEDVETEDITIITQHLTLKF